MSERSFNIRIKECSISFVVPISKVFCNTRGLVKTVKKLFASLRDCSEQHEEKVEYNLMRDMFEHADMHGATWCEITPVDESAVVTLYFADITGMINFQEGVIEAVESKIMT